MVWLSIVLFAPIVPILSLPMLSLFHTKNEVLIFLINFFLLETIGGGLFLLFIRLLRFFGLPQLFYLYYGNENSGHLLFSILLLAALIISLVRLQKKKKRIRSLINRHKDSTSP